MKVSENSRRNRYPKNKILDYNGNPQHGHRAKQSLNHNKTRVKAVRVEIML